MKYFTTEVVNKLSNYFMQKLNVVPHRTGWLRQGLCPSCGKEKKYGINVWMNRSNCFSCGYHPTPLNLLMKLEDLNTLNEAYSFLNVFEGAEYLETKMPVIEQKEVVLPESFTLLSLGNDRYGKIARNYMRERGYDIDTLTMKGVGYCTTGDYAFRIIIPFYERGKLVYFNARQFIMISTKHKNPSMDEFGIGKAQIIYNVDALHLYSRVFILESATNCLTLGDTAIGTGGKIMSEYQRSKILRSPCKKVIIILDPDAHWEAYQTALQLVGHKQVKVVELPDVYKGKKNPDVNDIGRKKTMELVKKTEYMKYGQLYQRFIKQNKPIHRMPTA